MRYLKLLWGIQVISIQRELTFRVNLLFQGLVTVVGLGASLVSLGIVFSRTETLGGWRLQEVIVLLGIYYAMSGILETFIEPNLSYFAVKVRTGELDDFLLQPIPSILSASLGASQPWALSQVVLGSATSIVGLTGLNTPPSVLQLASFLVFLCIGIVIMWSSRLLLASFAFWAPHVEPDILYTTIWQLARFPVAVYPPVVRSLLTFCVPLAFIATMPSQALTQGVGLGATFAGISIAVVAIAIVVRVWNAGLRRYTSATS